MAKKIKVKIQGNIQLPLLSLREGKWFVVMTPALDLVAQGETLKKAHKNFEISLKLFLEECLAQGTLEQVLEESGWTKVTKPKPHFMAPVIIEKSQKEFQIPVFSSA
jgi:predicted RNase H-like HicB family nuclease